MARNYDLESSGIKQSLLNSEFKNQNIRINTDNARQVQNQNAFGKNEQDFEKEGVKEKGFVEQQVKIYALIKIIKRKRLWPKIWYKVRLSK
jgi:hypothetical protein